PGGRRARSGPSSTSTRCSPGSNLPALSGRDRDARAFNRAGVGSSGDVLSSRHLPGWPAHPPPWLAAVVLVSILVPALSFVAHQVFSWRRATGERRQQPE